LQEPLVSSFTLLLGDKKIPVDEGLPRTLVLGLCVAANNTRWEW